MSFVNKSPVHWTDIMTLQTSQRLTPWLRKEWILHSEINSTHQSINKTVEQNWRLHLYKLGCGGSESGSDGHAVIDEALKQRFNQSMRLPVQTVARSTLAPTPRLTVWIELNISWFWTHVNLSQFIVPQWKTLIYHDQFPTSIKLRVFYMK